MRLKEGLAESKRQGGRSEMILSGFLAVVRSSIYSVKAMVNDTLFIVLKLEYDCFTALLVSAVP